MNFREIWKDPVWSKVISSFIITTLGFIFIVMYSLVSEKSFKESFIFMMNLKFPLYFIFLLIIGLLLIQFSFFYLSGKIKIQSKDEKILNTKIKAIVGQNYTYHFKDVNVLARYSVDYNQKTGKPFVYDINLFCKNHTPPLKFTTVQCYMTKECQRIEYNLTIQVAQKILESDILQAWDDLDKKESIIKKQYLKKIPK